MAKANNELVAACLAGEEGDEPEAPVCSELEELEFALSKVVIKKSERHSNERSRQKSSLVRNGGGVACAVDILTTEWKILSWRAICSRLQLSGELGRRAAVSPYGWHMPAIA